MSRRTLVMVGLLMLVVAVGLGCDATVPKKDYDALGSEYNKSLSDNKTLQDQLEAANREKDNLQRQLEQMKTELPEGATVHTVGGQPAIQIEAALLYASGSAKLSAAGESTLRQVADLIKKRYANCEIRVEGHTDTDPIRKTADKYDTNWDLGAKRANEVVVFLTQKCGVDSKRIYSASYSMYRPISRNKASNRRVEIVLLPPMTPGSSIPGSSMTGEVEEK